MSEGAPQLLGGGRRSPEVPVPDRTLERLELAVDPRGLAAVQGGQDPVADVVEGEEIAVDPGRVSRSGVDDELRQPEVEASEVDLDHGPVAELEVEAGLSRIDR